MVNVPKLRFPEFSGEWEKTELGRMGTFMKGSAIGKKDLAKNGEPCILYGELYTKYGETVKEVLSKTNNATNSMLRSKHGDVLIPSSGETASDIATCTCVLVDNVLIGGDINLFRGTSVNGIFISYALNHKRNDEIARLAQGASVVHIYSKQLEKVLMPTPSLPEQTKIANFLTLFDKKIEKQSEKVAALEEYKKGLMHKIFSRKIRFKDDEGQDYPEWEEVKLGDVGTTYNGLSGKTKIDFGLGNKMYITYMNVFNNTITAVEAVERVKINPGENQNKVSYGDILFTTSSETRDEVGMSSVWLHDSEVYLNSFCFGYRLKVRKMFDIYFIAYLLRSPEMRKRITTLSQGSTRYNLSKNALMKLHIYLPTVTEQTKIANFLSLFDRKIEKEKAKLEALREQKKGLLQQMFV